VLRALGFAALNTVAAAAASLVRAAGKSRMLRVAAPTLVAVTRVGFILDSASSSSLDVWIVRTIFAVHALLPPNAGCATGPSARIADMFCTPKRSLLHSPAAAAAVNSLMIILVMVTNTTLTFHECSPPCGGNKSSTCRQCLPPH
jgi:hypothetical protein